jgi:hypothetical protein
VFDYKVNCFKRITLLFQKCGRFAENQNSSEVTVQKMSADETSYCYECCSTSKCNKDICTYPPSKIWFLRLTNTVKGHMVIFQVFFVEEDIWCPSVRYFRHEWVLKLNHHVVLKASCVSVSK